MQRKCNNCDYHDNYTGACGCADSDHVADFTGGDFLCRCHKWGAEISREVIAAARDVLMENKEMYDAFVASVLSAMKDRNLLDSDEAQARHVADRVIGVEHET